MRIFLIITICSVFYSNAQELESNPDPYNKTHETRINALYLVLGGFEVSYEYLLNEESAIGMHMFIPYDDDIINDIQYYVSPYYRFYFGKKYAAGFFLEGFGMLNSTDRDLDFFFENKEDDYITDFALGIGFGGKWVTKSGFIGELSYGLGRNLFKSDETDLDFIGRAGIILGYRF